MAYTDANRVSNFLGRALTQYETDQITDLAAAVKIWIDKKLNSTFDQVSPSVRYYDGGVRSLDIDPCTAVTAVVAVNDDGTDSYTYTDTYEIILEPQNETVKREIRKRLAAFPRGVHRIAVSATFSEYDGGVPSDITILATRLVAGILRSGKTVGDGNISSESLEGHSISYNTGATSLQGIATTDPTVMEILASRAELYVDTYDERNENGYDDDGGLMA